MLSRLTQWLKLLWSHRLGRLAIQLLGTTALLWVLLTVVPFGQLVNSFRAIEPGWLVLSFALMLLSYLVNVLRWKILLSQVGISVPVVPLTRYYFLGLFFNLFLPTSAGGDVARVVEVTRRGHPGLRAFLATFQERLLGLGMFVGVGLIGAICFFSKLPTSLAWLALLSQLGLFGLSLLLLYPHMLIAIARFFTQWLPLENWAQRFPRITDSVQSLRELPPIRLGRLVILLSLSLLSALLMIGGYFAVALATGMAVSFGALCLIVPLVILIRMLPISLNGIGVGEGAFLLLCSFFGGAQSEALAVGLAVLALQTAISLLGSLELLGRALCRQKALITDFSTSQESPGPAMAS